MAGNRRVQSTPSGLKWKGSERSRESLKGIKPLPDPMTLKTMSVVLVMHLCRKYLVMDTLKKLSFYAAELVLGSVLCDFFPIPKSYFSNKGNALNRYFAKLSWGWTLVLVGLFTALTSNVYCCGKRQLIRRHLSRLLVGTAVWYLCTQGFLLIEAWTGSCLGAGGDPGWTREECVSHSRVYKPGFDISGHSFLLIFCCLVVHEEAKAIKGWDRIRDLIREVDFIEDSPLKNLTDDELSVLKTSYDKYDLYVKLSFVSITVLSLMWDVTLVGTILYYHTIPQKVAGGFVAIAAWFVTYKVWYNWELSPGQPGQGPFKYNVDTKPMVEDRRRSIIRPPLRPFGQRNGTQKPSGDHEKII